MPPPISPAERDVSRARRIRPPLELTLFWLVIAGIWGGLLPRLAVQPAIRARLDELERAGIDASAMYYTELPAMQGVLEHLEEFRRAHPDDLWVPASRMRPMRDRPDRADESARH